MAGKTVNFEEALARLEDIVEQLDSGNLPLAKSLDLFKEGTRLAKVCRELLTQAELAVKDALGESGSATSSSSESESVIAYEAEDEEDGA